jgi:hypothetical protein
VSFLYRLERRMEKKQFPVDDPLRVAVQQAYDKIHTLWIKVHYMSCEGAGRTNKKADEKSDAETSTEISSCLDFRQHASVDETEA